ncbi:GNAT family N-acetyltransferase [Pelomonas sp. KK5]|uniref:GNAT family N-acetyltransferase n=1 Tax=Pelomonas sp. KK5 TaxID=1855730 RepID=UPI00097C6A9E|nr:GNAT family N-acetyltransferase [Pelomonas sp. KK5]
MLVLETPRLRLRWYTEADAAFILQLLNEPSWLAHIGQRNVKTLDEARSWIRERLIGNYERQGFGFWAVERIEDGQLVGMCGLVKRDTLPEVDIGYAFLPAFWHQGYAREAAAACLAHAHNALGLRRVLAITGPDNAASARVLESIGMHHEDTRVLAGEERITRVFAIDFPD